MGYHRASKNASEDFRTSTIVPVLARERKTSLDKLLLDFKKDNKDFKYIIRNGVHDLEVYIKRISEEGFIPYRKVDIEEFGSISPLKPTTAPEVSNGEINPDRVDPQGYISPRKGTRKQSYRPKEEIFASLRSTIDGFSPRRRNGPR